MKQQVLARDSLKKNQMFSVLYELIIYVAMPIAFELSFVKIFQKSMNAFHMNDFEGIGRLIVYFAIQWFLGMLVRNKYLSVISKRMTLALLILLQVKEAFFEEVLFDMMLSIIMESGMMVLLFFKFVQWVVILQLIGLVCLTVQYFIGAINHRLIAERVLGELRIFHNISFMQMFMRIHPCMIRNSWNRHYC